LDALMPLTYRDKGTTGTQLAIYSHDLCIDHLGKEFMSIMAGRQAFWEWNFSLGNAVPPGFPRNGHADTCEEAKAIVETAWTEWLATAGLSERAP
jgi:hypothetical protein